MWNGMLGYRLFWAVDSVAGSLNPNTGDRNATIMKYVVAALIVSAIAIVVYLVAASKKKKNGKPKKK